MTNRGLAAIYSFEETRERVQAQLRRQRRPAEIRAEERRLQKRRETPIAELLTEEERERLTEVAPALMRMEVKNR
jgi:hypothetical protein